MDLKTFRTATLKGVNVTIGVTDRFHIYDSYRTRELTKNIIQARQCWTIEERVSSDRSIINNTR